MYVPEWGNSVCYEWGTIISHTGHFELILRGALGSFCIRILSRHLLRDRVFVHNDDDDDDDDVFT